MKRLIPQTLLGLVFLAVGAPGSVAGAQPVAAAPAAEVDAGLETVSFITYASPAAGFRLFDNCHFSADRRRLLVTTDAPRLRKHVVRVYDLASGTELFKREGAAPESRALMGDGISPDGSRVLLSELDSKVKQHVHVIEVEGGRVVWSGEHSAGEDVTFLNDGNRVLSNELGPSLIHRLSLLDVDAGRPLWQVELEKGLSSPLMRISQDGKFLLGWRDAKVPDPACVIDLETRQVVAILEESARLLMPQFQMMAGRAEVIGLLNGELVRWDITTGKVVRRVDVGGGGSGPDQHALSPEGSRFYLRHGNTITVRDTTDGKLLGTAKMSLPPDMVAAGPADLIVLRTFPGQFRVARFGGAAKKKDGE
jgi:hypothetical protein